MRRRPWESVVLYGTLFLISLFFVLPVLAMISMSLKGGTTDLTDTGLIPRDPSLDNYRTLFENASSAPVVNWLINSTLTSVIGTALTVVVASLSAYAFARMDFPGRRLIFAGMIATLTLPGVLFLIPQIILINDLGLYNTIPAFFLPGLAGVFGVFFMRQFFLSVPVELEEAAFVDGANSVQTFLRVVMPLAGPALATLSVITFLAFWNDYLWPLVVCQGSGCTLQPGYRASRTST